MTEVKVILSIAGQAGFLLSLPGVTSSWELVASSSLRLTAKFASIVSAVHSLVFECRAR